MRMTSLRWESVHWTRCATSCDSTPSISAHIAAVCAWLPVPCELILHVLHPWQLLASG